QRVLALQRSAGNAAVGRVLARDTMIPSVVVLPPMAGTGTSGPYLIGQPLGPVTTGKNQYKPVPDAVADAIRTYIMNVRISWGDGVLNGTISMPEAVDEIRQHVAGAQDIQVWQIADIVRATLMTQAPPETRRKLTGAGALSELAATLANSFAKVPTK